MQEGCLWSKEEWLQVIEYQEKLEEKWNAVKEQENGDVEEGRVVARDKNEWRAVVSA